MLKSVNEDWVRDLEKKVEEKQREIDILKDMMRSTEINYKSKIKDAIFYKWRVEELEKIMNLRGEMS